MDSSLTQLQLNIARIMIGELKLQDVEPATFDTEVDLIEDACAKQEERVAYVDETLTKEASEVAK